MATVIRVERDKDIAVVVIDNPPINAGSHEVRVGLLQAVEQAAEDAELQGLVLIGAGTTFIAGSDIREFGKPLADPTLPAVIAAIEACPKPVVAALHGAALGGGFELALACDARVALSGAVVGLPEVTLGIIPGAGGTQRLSRLIGIARAITAIATGERIAAEAALSLGIVDRVVTSNLRETAVDFARTMHQKRRLRDQTVPAADDASVAKAAVTALKAGKNRPAIQTAIEAIKLSAELPIDEGLAWERNAFQSLRTSREARALRHQFFAERDTAKLPVLKGATPLQVGKIAVIGAGTMGTGIAIAALEGGFDVFLLEQDEAALQRGTDRIKAHYSSRVNTGKMDAAQAAEREARLTSGLDWNLLSDADLVIEAVFEDLTVKQNVFRQLDALARPGAILASNTSYLDLDAIAAATKRPEYVFGLHFFSPAHVMRLLEIVRGSATSPNVLATGLQVAKRLRKMPVFAGNAFGFIGNRIYAAYRRQCEFMIEEGATPQQVDAALEKFGFAMGPFAVADLSGLDIAWRMRQSQAGKRDPKARYVRIPDMLCEAGRLGQKTGAGYYAYGPSGVRSVDPAVDQVLEQARAEKGIKPRVPGDDEIVKRVLLSMVNEASLLLAEGVATRASDIDVAMVNGYGFPKWEGGPVFWAQDRSEEELRKDLDWLAELSGPGFAQGNPQTLLSEVQSG